MEKFSRILEAQRAELGIITTNKYGAKSISSLNEKIRLYLNEIYGPFGYSYGENFDEDINVDGMVINTQYINKMVNNYMTFKRIIQLEGLRTEDEFYSYMENNMSDVYHWKGKYFLTYVLPILIATSRRGNDGEINSLRFFVEELNKKMNIIVDIISPTIQEDVSGIDAKFMWNNKELTIQVKPFTRIVKSDESVRAYSQGSLSVNTDYLILYKILPSNNYSFIIFRRRDVTIKSDYFEADLNKIVAEK
jgi:hypothetical protein